MKSAAFRTSFVFALLTCAVAAQDPAADHYRKALQLNESGQLDPAIAELERAVTLRPDFAEAHNALGLLLGKKGSDTQAVIFQFRRAIEIQPNFASAHHNLGLVLAQLGRIDECIAEFRLAIAADSSDPNPYNSLALTVVERNVDEAIQLFQKAIELRADYVEAQFNLALAYRRKYGVEREVEQLKKALALAPEHLVVRNTLTRRYEEMGNYAEVGHLAMETLKTHPDSAEAQYFGGKALLKQGRTAEGMAHLKEAARLAPDFSEPHYHLAIELRRQGNRADADSEFAIAEQLREKQHRDIAASIQMGNAALKFERGELAGAIETLRETVKSQPAWPDAHWRLGMALLRQGETKEAVDCFRQAIALDDNYFEAHYYLGVVSLNNKDWATAETELRKAVELRKNSVEAQRALAEVTSQQAPAALKLGKEKLDSGNLAGATEEFRRAATLNPGLPEAWQFYGTALLTKGEVSAASAALQKAINLRPGYFEALYNLGLAHARQGDMDRAIENFRLALEQQETSAECHDSLAVALATTKDYPSAIREFRRAIELKSNWGLAHFHLGSALRLAGDSEGAALAFTQAQRLDPSLGTR